MLVIWGRTNSVNVQKVLWCCEELGLAYDRIDAGGPFGIVDTPAYLRRNPNGLVPTIDDDGFILWESNAIVRYLAAKHGSSLWPADPRVRAEADQWMDWSQTTFWPTIRTAFLGLIRTPPEQRNESAIEESLSKTAEILVRVDDRLRSRPYLAGDEFTVGDIALGCGVWRWLAMAIERPARPNVVRWFERLQQRPGCHKFVAMPLT
jgi:glutathione S-transferase